MTLDLPPGDLSLAPSRLTMLFEHLGLGALDQMTIGDLLRYAPDADDTGLTLILALMFAALSEGSLCLDLDDQDLIQKMGKGAGSDFGTRIAEFIARLDRGAYDTMIDRKGDGGFKPLVLDDGAGRRLLYFQKFHYHEQRLKHCLKIILQSRKMTRPPDPQAISQIIDDLYQDCRVIRKGVDGVPIVKDKYQLDAIRAALTTRLLVISGGPGTGKTSLLVNILRALVRTGTDPARMLLAAPTGRAAQRMSESLHANLAGIRQLEPGEQGLWQLTGATLHKLLCYRSRTDDFAYGERNLLPADVIAVDEVSMVDVVMMDHLFQAIDPVQTKIILIGDRDQLPSVEAGAVLADISAAAQSTAADHLVVLHNVYRSAGELTDLAHSINGGKAVGLQSVEFETAIAQSSGNWSFVAATDENQLNRMLDYWVWHHFVQPATGQAHSYVDLVNQVAALPEESDGRDALMHRLFAHVRGCRVLTVTRLQGPTGMQWVNTRIAGALKSILDPGANPHSRFFNGAVVMVTRNDYARELFNGDTGVVLRRPDGGYDILFQRSNEVMGVPLSDVADCELAFAMTVHKSQGSEFDDTLLILPEDGTHRLLTREIVYTAVTRAAKRLVIYGTRIAFQTALQRKIKRQSGF